ncbi:MAG: autotransporter outer membrane beta-barrel domain-containing protein, partial [Arenimonas sp.]|nr:autotransporter outer membrane beta-barrel domain-containing protein [Arenimonas sp.]
ADDGDDFIYNNADGRIFLTNDTIDLAGGYNYFFNDGKLYADGLNNSIDMGTNYSESSANTFYNYGNSIHMDDGATNDALTIIGNFAGDGSIVVDVDGQSLSSDRLYIEGDVVSGTANVVDVNLLSIPDASDIVDGITIPIVTVSGANVAGNFVLGDVDFVNNTLFTTDFTLVRETPTTDFSLAFEVTGLSAAGILLSTVGPAMQNLWFSSLGTMYQRQGGERNFEEGGAQDTQGAAGAWFRLYGSDGSLSPDAKRSNFGAGGSQDFSISTSGIEAGFGYSFNSDWTVGLFGGFNDGSFKPDVGGNVSIDGTTWGGYVTFTPGNGFYADLSYRDISYDGDALVSGTRESLDGSASGYSLEMGYGFKMSSGLEIEPQLQYSDVSVDFDNIAYNSGDFELTDGDASQLRVGVAARQSFNQDSGVWTPYAALSYVENYSGSNRYLIGGALDGQVDVSGGSMLLELGTDARYGHFMFNAGVGWQNGGAFDSVLTGQVNVRYSW